MSAPIQPQAGGHFWVFDDRQLDAALDDWRRSLNAREVGDGNINLLISNVRKFMHSAYCVEQGMRRGDREV